MARLQDAQQQAINNYLRFGDVSCKRSGTREQLAYHSDAKHALSLDGREQLLSHILEMETPELMNSSNSDGNQQGCQLSWSSDFQLLPLSSGHMNNTYSSRTAGEQQQQVVVARGFARGEVLGFVLGCMMPSSDAEQLLLSAATPEEALQMVRLSFRFELEGEEEQRQQQLQGGSSSSSSKSVTVVTAGFKNGNPLAQVWFELLCAAACCCLLEFRVLLCTLLPVACRMLFCQTQGAQHACCFLDTPVSQSALNCM
jgi:hypothetical protein